MRGWGTLTLVAVGLGLGATMAAWAQDQQQPSNVIERRIQGQVNQGPYFQPTPQPYQGSFARGWQRKLEEMWGGTNAGQGVPPPDNSPIYLPPPRDLIFVHPPLVCDVYGNCYWRRQLGWGPGPRPFFGWYGWRGRVR